MSPPEGLLAEPRGTVPPRWGMAIDLNRCVGCQTCTIACKHANNTPPGVQWRQVLDVELGAYPDVERLFLPVGCQQCDDPPCVPVCPTGATYRRPDGIVVIDYDRCIGCATCAVACPYQARHLVLARDFYYRDEDTWQERAVADPARLGVAQKCTFCMGKLDAAQARGLMPGLDPDATPACAVSCIAQAITFGDLNDPESRVSRLLRENESFAMHEALGTRPSIRYLYETPAIPGRTETPAVCGDGRDEDPANPLVGRLQTRWDARAAANFMLGGLGSGLAIAAVAARIALSLDDHATQVLLATAAGIMAVGLFFVLLKLGRKWRLAYALRRPQTSWMSREVYCVGAFYLLVAASLLWPGTALYAFAAAAAAGFLFCQGRILQACRGIPAWRLPIVTGMIAATGLLEGMGAVIVGAAALGGGIAATPATVAMIVLAALNGALWHRYRSHAAASGIPPLARRAIDAMTPAAHGLGHLLPAAAALAAMILPAQGKALLIVSALAAIAGGQLWKYALITRIGYQQGFALPKLPQRGSGRRAAPGRIAARPAATVNSTEGANR